MGRARAVVADRTGCQGGDNNQDRQDRQDRRDDVATGLSVDIIALLNCLLH